MSRPLLSAALIVRDEASHLPDCLASLAGVADEVVIVDTGSADDTVAIARAHGARVFSHPWNGGFAEPRNVGLDEARGEWILYLDADERVRPIARERLAARLRDAPESALRILLRPVVHSTPYFEYRLWRNDPRVRFQGVMHERVVDAIHAVAAADGSPIGDWAELSLDHVGYEGDQTAKHRRNLPLLEAQLRVEPDNIYDWRHLSRVLRGLGRDDEGEVALERAVTLARAQALPTVDGGLAWADLIRLRHEQGADVSDLLADGHARWPEHWLLTWIEGQVHLDAGRLEPAADCFRRLLAVDADELPARGIAYDERIFGAYAAASLGLALFRLGRFADAAAAYAEAERRAPGEAEYRVKRLLAQARAGAAAPRPAG